MTITAEGLVRMEGFARQKAVARDPKRKAQRVHFRRYVVPSATRESLPARLCLAEAAQKAWGRSFEEVVTSVSGNCSGKDYGGRKKRDAIKSARHLAATANIAKMRSMLAAA